MMVKKQVTKIDIDASLDRLFKTAMAMKARHDRYEKALQAIVDAPNWSSEHMYKDIARRALEVAGKEKP